jgi:mannose-6-phosphate isomerase-like protein (cupin superfamily)
MSTPPLFDVHHDADELSSYHNAFLSQVNDHVIRVSVMTEPFFWHYHPNSDESFLVTEGVFCIDLEDGTIELTMGQGYTIAAGLKHRTRPKGERSVNLTFERADLQTVKC